MRRLVRIGRQCERLLLQRLDFQCRLCGVMSAQAGCVNGGLSTDCVVDHRHLLKGITVSRLTLPDDANIYGNVHGGTILKLLEEAGGIIATRYCNNATSQLEPAISAMVRLEQVDFLQPMMIGEVAELTAEIIYTSPHSLEVEVIVQAENIFNGVRRNTNRARLWYVPVGSCGNVMCVPPMTYATPAVEEERRKAYESQKLLRDKTSLGAGPPFIHIPDAKVGTASYSRTCLSFLVGQNDVTYSKHCRGGVVLKLMDECAGIVAAKHCRTNVVTACLNATNFYKMIKIGSVVTVFGVITFTSGRSLEIEVIVEVEVPFEKEVKVTNKVIDAFFTYVAIDSHGKALPVPPLQIESDDERSRYDEGLKRYETRRLQKRT